MKVASLLEVVDAAHNSCHVESPFQQRGAIFLIGPPGVFKTTIVECALEAYPNALVLSDVNVRTLNQMKDELISGRFRTFGFPAYEKLYQRDIRTASNVEGTVSQLIQEGFKHASFENAQIPTIKARALVVAATTHSFFSSQFSRWKDSGFLRRMLVFSFRLKHPDLISNCIDKWEKATFSDIARKEPRGAAILWRPPHMLTDEESRYAHNLVKHQNSDDTPFVMVKKIICYLKWKYGTKPHQLKRVWEIMDDVKPALSKDGAEIEL